MEKSDSVKAYIPHNIVEVSTTYETAYNDNIRARKQELINRLDSLNKTMIAVPSALSPSQKKYYVDMTREMKLINQRMFDLSADGRGDI